MPENRRACSSDLRTSRLFAFRLCISRHSAPSPAFLNRSWTASSAAVFSATKRMVLPACTAAAMTLVIVCDLPVPGGPWTTRFRPSRASSTTIACELSASTTWVQGECPPDAGRRDTCAAAPAARAGAVLARLYVRAGRADDAQGIPCAIRPDLGSRSPSWCTTHHLADNELELLTCAPMGAVARGRRPKLRFQNISGLPQGPAGAFRGTLSLR
jgi:hypothetical protein